MYHAILIDQSFTDLTFPTTFPVFNKKVAGSWGIYGIEIEDDSLEQAIADIQAKLKDDQPWYTHLYNDAALFVVFKQRVFRVTPHASTWQAVFAYGRELNIPEEQLDFWPNRFQDERYYFTAA